MNKGEWSEFYTFLRLLADGKLYAADADLNKKENLYYPLIKIIRRSKKYSEPLFYEISDARIIISASKNKEKIKEISTEKFNINAAKLLKIIKNASDSSFEAPEINDFITEIESPSIKEKPTSKRDITLVIHDINTNRRPKVGFSIKSKLGGASTLFNAHFTSNLQYKIEGLDELDPEICENLKQLKTKKLLKYLNDNKCKIIFQSPLDSHFESNLQMIDSNFPIILSEILKLYYSGFPVMIKDLTKKITELNPCDFKNNKIFPFYEHKMKEFLTACALGMTSKKPWNGSFDVSGGYIIVKENGDVLCYHLYNWNDFQEYLFNSTSVDTPSTTRHKFGNLNGNKLNLNFQIRFN